MKKARSIKKENPEKVSSMLKNTKKESKETKKGMALTDQFSYGQVDTSVGRNKPSRLTHYDLRNLANNNSLVRICVNRAKHQVTKVPYVIRARDPKQHEKLQDQIKFVELLLRTPNQQPNQNSYRSLFSMVLEDLLVLDQGYIEKVRNSRGYIMQLYHVDAATIKPAIDEYGMYKDPAYYQFISPGSEKPDAEFSVEDLMSFMVNPQGASGKTGYGLSPVEAIVSTVVASIQAALYNNNYFDDSRLPPAIVNLPSVPTEDLLAFKNAFEAQLSGKPWSNAYINADGAIDVKLLRPSNQEMQFYELNLWLARIIFAAFEVSPQDLGFTMDVNKATATVEERLSKNGGISNMLDVITEEINSDIIQDLAELDPRFDEIEFAFDDQDKIDEATQASTDAIYIQNNVLTPNEVRIRKGLDPIEGLDENINETPQPEIKAEQQPDKAQEKEPIDETNTTKTYKNLDKWIKLYQ